MLSLLTLLSSSSSMFACARRSEKWGWRVALKFSSPRRRFSQRRVCAVCAILKFHALQELKESFNYGLFCPPVNGKAGKFLDEERRLGDYPFNGPVGYLEVRRARAHSNAFHLSSHFFPRQTSFSSSSPPPRPVSPPFRSFARSEGRSRAPPLSRLIVIGGENDGDGTGKKEGEREDVYFGRTIIIGFGASRGGFSF